MNEEHPSVNSPSVIVNVVLAVPPAPSLTVTVTCSEPPVSPDTFERRLVPEMLKEAELVPPVTEYDSVCPTSASVDDNVPMIPLSASGGV